MRVGASVPALLAEGASAAPGVQLRLLNLKRSAGTAPGCFTLSHAAERTPGTYADGLCDDSFQLERELNRLLFGAP